MNIADELARVTEAYCIEHNLPSRRRFTHDELAPAIAQVRAAQRILYGDPGRAIDKPESGE